MCSLLLLLNCHQQKEGGEGLLAANQAMPRLLSETRIKTCKSKRPSTAACQQRLNVNNADITMIQFWLKTADKKVTKIYLYNALLVLVYNIYSRWQSIPDVNKELVSKAGRTFRLQHKELVESCVSSNSSRLFTLCLCHSQVVFCVFQSSTPLCISSIDLTQLMPYLTQFIWCIMSSSWCSMLKQKMKFSSQLGVKIVSIQ